MVNVTKQNDKFLININGQELTLNEGELREINRLIDRFWYEEDVRNYIEEKEWFFNEDTISEIVDIYSDLRFDNNGDSEGLPWDECLKQAFEGYEYGDELTEKMWLRLKEKIVKKEDLIKDFLEDAEFDECDTLDIKLEKAKEQTEDCDLIEWYKEFVG